MKRVGTGGNHQFLPKLHGIDKTQVNRILREVGMGRRMETRLRKGNTHVFESLERNDITLLT